MVDIIEDLIRLQMYNVDSYNAKIHQIYNEKYTNIDKAILTVYLFIKIVEDRSEKNDEVAETLTNYLLRQSIYGETGNIIFEISDTSKVGLYNEILDKLVLKKFEYRNRLMKKLKYKYENLSLNKYTELIVFLEDIAELAIFEKVLLRGNREVSTILNKTKEKIIRQLDMIDKKDCFYNEKTTIINLIKDSNFKESQYGNLLDVALNLRDVYRYSNMPSQLPENVLFHQYNTTILSLLLTQYCNKELKEKFNIYTLISKSLFHDFGEYKGTEIITQLKNYNEVTKKMFAEIEERDEKELENRIGTNLYNIILESHAGAEGYVSELIDKVVAFIKIWVEVDYLNNYTWIRLTNSIFQDRFKKFLRVENIDNINKKSFYLDFLREAYIYLKEHLVKKDTKYFLKYFTIEEMHMYEEEIENLRNNPDTFLQ